MECNYHKVIPYIIHFVTEKIDEHWEWQYFSYWLGDDSELGAIYIEGVNSFIPTISQEQENYIKNLGVNLEKQIAKWRYQQNNNEGCVREKIREYIYYQFKNPKLRAIVGNPC
jgi:hypothetical protein